MKDIWLLDRLAISFVVIVVVVTQVARLRVILDLCTTQAAETNEN
jgi:hypothetical protein